MQPQLYSSSFVYLTWTMQKQMFYNVPEITLNKYQTIQNIYAKIALNKSKYLSSTKALKTLNWLPIQPWIQYKILTLMFKCIYNMAPGYLQEPITIKQNSRENMRSNNKGTILKIPKVKREMFTAGAILIFSINIVEWITKAYQRPYIAGSIQEQT